MGCGLEVCGLLAAVKLGRSDLSKGLCPVLYVFSSHAIVNKQCSGNISAKERPVLGNSHASCVLNFVSPATSIPI